MKTLNIILMLCLAISASAQVDTNASKLNALKKVDKEAQFPTGMEGLSKFFESELRYPKKAVEKNIQGSVEIEFVVCEDGTICSIKAINESDSLLIDEAKRVVAKMPKWEPGIYEGKPVSMYFTLPVNFTLSEEERPRRKLFQRRN
jgi:TonB family protein